MNDDKSKSDVAIEFDRFISGPAKIHMLPCKIHHDGPAPISAYFLPQSKSDEAPNDLYAEFRGRKLMGHNQEIPKNVDGFVIRENQSDHSSNWSIKSFFNEVTLWGHDETPKNHIISDALNWIDIAKSVHDPL